MELVPIIGGVSVCSGHAAERFVLLHRDALHRRRGDARDVVWIVGFGCDPGAAFRTGKGS